MSLPECPGRDGELAQLLALLPGGGPIAVRGAPGIGTTRLAGVVAARLGGRAVSVSVAGCETHADVVRAIGDAVGVYPCGDEAAARAELGERRVIADDVAPASAAALLALDLPGSVLLVGDAPPALPGVTLGPLPHEVIDTLAPGARTGNPLHAVLAQALGLTQLPADALPAALARALAPARGLVGLPMGIGLRVDVGVPAAALRPDGRQRRALRRGVAELLWDGRAASALEADGAAYVRAALADRPERAQALRAWAYGAPASGVPDPRDLLLLRLLARSEPADALAACCAAVGARLAVEAGQVGEARSLLTQVRSVEPADRALLRWVDGDALLALGDLDAAREAWSAAEDDFLRLVTLAERGPEAAATARGGWIALTLSSAERLALRGYHALAADRVMRARQLARDARPPRLQDVAATWRASASLAAAGGDPSAAAQFLAEAADLVRFAGRLAGDDTPQLALIEAALRAGRSDNAGAQEALADARSDVPLWRANLVRRRADLLLREGMNVRAGRAAREAAALYASVGQHVSSAQSLGVAADALALSGHLDEAAHLYAAVIAQQVRVQDLAGLERSLLRAARVDDARGAHEAAQLRRAQREAVSAARGPRRGLSAVPRP